MPRENPWQGIGAASGSRIRARRVSEVLKHDFYWATNVDGQYTFLLQVESDPGEWGPVPELRGITVGYYRNARQVQLILNDRADWEMFLVLCNDLIQAADECVTPRDVMDSLMARLVRWQRLLSRGPRKILDDRAIRGLIGELLFLRDELVPRFGSRAVEFWQGPARLPQDFAVGGYLFEVKTHLVGDAPKIYISSPSQLWGGASPLFVVVIPLAHCGRHSPGMVTLTRLVDQLTKMMVGKPQLEVLESRLIESGYFPFPEYEDATYAASPPKWYEVRSGFPKIAENAIPPGVEDAKYAIRTIACEPFEAKPDWKVVMEKLK